VEVKPIDAELLKLLRAFAGIEDPEARQLILKITEAAARGASLKAVVYPLNDTTEIETKLN
jgi:hypothetical protein